MTFNTTRWNRIRYGLYAPVYDISEYVLKPGRKRSIELLNPQPGEKILIDGAGTGLDLSLLPEGADVTAIDLTPGMVRRIQQRAGALGRSVDARVMDAEQLEFEDKTFDAVILHLILAVMPDPVAGIREAARVLKPGGRIAIYDKFLPDGQAPGLARKAVNSVINLFFTDLNRQLQPLLDAADLKIDAKETAFGGNYVMARVVKR